MLSKKPKVDTGRWPLEAEDATRLRTDAEQRFQLLEDSLEHLKFGDADDPGAPKQPAGKVAATIREVALALIDQGKRESANATVIWNRLNKLSLDIERLDKVATAQHDVGKANADALGVVGAAAARLSEALQRPYIDYPSGSSDIASSETPPGV